MHTSSASLAVATCPAEHANSNLYCINLPLVWSDEDVRAAFAMYGSVLSVRLLTPIPGCPGKVGAWPHIDISSWRMVHSVVAGVTMRL